MRETQSGASYAPEPKNEIGDEKEPMFVEESQSSAIPPRTGYPGDPGYTGKT